MVCFVRLSMPQIQNEHRKIYFYWLVQFHSTCAFYSLL